MTDGESPLLTSFVPHITPDSHTLILGSMPGQASLNQQQYYAHPRNQFWPIMATLLQFDVQLPYAQRLQHLLSHGFALWDVIAQCKRPGSLDSQIERNSIAYQPFTTLLENYPGIARIACNGQMAAQLFRKNVQPTLLSARAAALPVLTLPSSSPAHASKSLNDKIAVWQEALFSTN